MSKRTRTILFAVAALAVLAVAFWYGGNAPDSHSWNAQTPVESADIVQQEQTPDSKPSVNSLPEETPSLEKEPASNQGAEAPSPTEKQPSTTPQKPANSPDPRPGGTAGSMSASEKVAAATAIAGGSSNLASTGDSTHSRLQGMNLDSDIGKDPYRTNSVPEGKPLPVEPQDVTISDKAYTCTLSVRCDTILDHMDWLTPEKTELVPKDGVIFPTTQVTFYEGESVFNVLQRELKQAKIHMEFVNTPIYNSAYMEGIHNLYELDCGELSGWMYKVNGWFPNYGSSRYGLKDGDVIEWVFTCNLGVDVGGSVAAGG